MPLSKLLCFIFQQFQGRRMSNLLNFAEISSIPIAEPIKDYYHHILLNYPKKVVVTSVALAALTLLTYQHSGFSRLCSIATISSATLGMCLSYQWSHLFRQIWHGLLNRSYEPSFKPTFREDTFLGSNKEVLATLEYKNALPILTFTSEVKDPAQRGYIHGYMLADQIVDLGQKALRPMFAFLQWEKGEKGYSEIKKMIDRLTIPDEDRSELLGIAKGVEERLRLKGKTCPKETIDFIFAAHVLTDHYKAIGSSLGCSAVVYRAHSTDAPIVGRNLDWVSMGYLGRHLFVRRYEVNTENGKRLISSFSFPGYIGVLTAWNSNDLVVIVNELGKVSKGNGKPYSLMTKELIEKCASVDEAVKWLDQHQKKSPCASSVSIVLADPKEAKIFHYYPKEQGSIVIKNLSDDGILTVTNHANDLEGNVLLESICEKKSIVRLSCLQTALKLGKHEGKEPIEIVESALKAAGVAATVGVFIADLSSGKKKLVLDDFFAHNQIDKQPYLKI
jgi:hypothetical protein